MTHPAIQDPHTGPIRTYREIAEIMRARGDKTMTASNAEWIHRQAINKLRKLLASERESQC